MPTHKVVDLTNVAREYNTRLLNRYPGQLIELEPKYIVQMAHLTTPATVWKYVESAVTKSKANLVMLDTNHQLVCSALPAAVRTLPAGQGDSELALRVRKERVRYNASKQLFAFSILYLFLLFAMLLVDRMAGGLFTPLWGHFPTGA